MRQLSIRSRIISLLLVCSSAAVLSAAPNGRCPAEHTVTAQVVALEQVYTYNRFGAFNPSGLIYALDRDVEPVSDDDTGGAATGARSKQPGKVQLRADKRARPLILRVNEGDCLEVTFTNLMSPTTHTLQEPYTVPGYLVRPPLPGMTTLFVDAQEPETRKASMHVNGMSNCANISSDGSYVGKNPSSLVAPGETAHYCWRAEHEGGFLLYSTAAMLGGEGDGGQQDLGLFGAVMVEPKGSKWYRSQVTEDELKLAVKKSLYGGTIAKPVLNPNRTPQIDYEAVKPDGTPDGTPVLRLLSKNREIIYSDLNAIIAMDKDALCDEAPSQSCGSYREFSVIFHDEIPAEQAFPALAEEGSPLLAVKDGTAINYGAAGLGAPVIANRMGIGPTKNCAECKFEEFFLSSWANGDPALVMKRDVYGKPTALYPDDPSNVHHSYLGDPVRFRNIHAGPKETHVFHLHAHQWQQDAEDPDSTYLDSQTISPGGSFTYDIRYGGSGNRNLTPGDAIFHCHLYPHFAQGMWELWRVHDVFEDGSRGRRLPDKEIAEGTPNPALVPIPHKAMPMLPTTTFPGYPFYIAGEAGHRPPQAPLDLDCQGTTDPASDCKGGEELNGGLPRHRIKDCADLKDCVEEGAGAANAERDERTAALAKPGVSNDLFTQGMRVSAANAARVHATNANPDFLNFARRLKKVEIERLPRTGTPGERAAMAFHEGTLYPLDPAPKDKPQNWPGGKGYTGYDSDGNHRTFWVNGFKPQPGAPFADPCGGDLNPRRYRTAYVQFDMTVNKWGWHDPQARVAMLEWDVAAVFQQKKLPEPLFIRANSGECVSFAATNLIPSTLNLDDFQIYTPTDVIGQHIHLVKFDVTASDGSGNGWNYEDGTLSADEVRERIGAHNAFKGTTVYQPVTHPLFRLNGALANDPRGLCKDAKTKFNLNEGDDTNPWCGAQTTMQRWWADPLLNKKPGSPGSVDRTLRTVFTHDHFGPSSHQHHGLYAALVVEPAKAEWWAVKDYAPIKGAVGTKLGDGIRPDGGPTSYAADVFYKEGGTAKRRREFNIAVADYAIVYDAEQRPVNAPSRIDQQLPLTAATPAITVKPTPFPDPEAISTKDPGTQLMNYRNEPIPLRIAEKTADGWKQKDKARGGDMADVFSSTVHASSAPQSTFLNLLNQQEKGFRKPGDPATPVLPAQPGEIGNGQVLVRLIQGAQEENHVFTMHGARWRSQPSSMNSGFRNAQQIGISEHFEAEFAFPYASRGLGSSNLNPEGTPDEADPEPDPAKKRRVTDHLWYSSATDNLWDGMWGLMRVASESTTGLMAATPAASDSGGQECPKNAPKDPTTFSVSAWLAGDILKDGRLTYNANFGISDPNAILFVVNDGADGKPYTQEQLKTIYTNKRPEPLILRAPAGACIEVQLWNYLPADLADGADAPKTWSYNMMPPIVDGFNFNQVKTSSYVGLHPQLLAMRLGDNDASNVGINRSSLAAPAKSRTVQPTPKTYMWYAGRWKADKTGVPIEFGATNLRDMGDVIKHSSHGAVGALIIEPENSYFSNDVGATAYVCASKTARQQHPAACSPDSAEFKFKEFVAVLQDDLSLERNGRPMLPLRGGDDAEDTGQKAINYATEPIWARLGAPDAAIRPEETGRFDMSSVLSSREPNAGCDPATQVTKLCDPPLVFEATAGMPVRFRILHPSGHPRQHGFTLFGHAWQEAPFTWGKNPLPGQEEEEGSRKIGLNPFSAWLGSFSGIGPARHLNIVTTAGGSKHVAGDYLFRVQESFSFNGGMWGIFRVQPKPAGGKP